MVALNLSDPFKCIISPALYVLVNPQLVLGFYPSRSTAENGSGSDWGLAVLIFEGHTHVDGLDYCIAVIPISVCASYRPEVCKYTC